jgi:hypothetical protein
MKLRNLYFKNQLSFLSLLNGVEIYEGSIFYNYEYYYFKDYATVEELLTKLDEVI